MLIRDKFIPTIFDQKNLIYLSILAVLAAIAQVTLGGVVRVTGSGLGCPDWPLCYGQIVPPFQLDALIEYSHRLSGAILGVLVLLAVGSSALEAVSRFGPVYGYLTAVLPNFVTFVGAAGLVVAIRAVLNTNEGLGLLKLRRK